MPASNLFRFEQKIAIALIALFTSTVVLAQEGEDKGYLIAKKSELTDLGFVDSKVNALMIIRDEKGRENRRSLEFRSLEVQDPEVGDRSLIVFDTPADIKGTALLSHAKILDTDDQWLYLPALKRVKRISSANKSGAFVSSEFAFEDFTAGELNKFDYRWIAEDQCGEYTCDFVERTPLYAYSGYTKQIVSIDQQYHQLREVEFYGRRGDLMKTLTLYNYGDYEGIWRAHNLRMVNVRNGKSTEIVYEAFDFNTGMAERDFVSSALSRIR